ncbi:MAG: hypothetical protein IKW58_02070 [Alphaproteobacteria bacterium]|nr:hypothetical protein [Alphaproteobacteria bacterium]
MTSIITENGYKNGVGFFDRVSKQIVIKHPCVRKKEAQEVFAWIEEAKTTGLKSFIVGVGMMDNFLDCNEEDNIYNVSRELVRGVVEKTKSVEAAFLLEVLVRLDKCAELEKLSLKCVGFNEHPAVFEMLLKNIRVLKSLRCLELNGSFFGAEQLVDLADFVSRTSIARIVWPEVQLDEDVVSIIARKFDENIALVDATFAPLELRKIAKRNRRRFFKFMYNSMSLSEEDVRLIKEYKDSAYYALNYEYQKLADMNKTLGGILV